MAKASFILSLMFFGASMALVPVPGTLAAGHGAAILQVADTDAAALKKRHHKEWQQLVTDQKAELARASETDKPALQDRHRAARRAMKDRHRAEWQALMDDKGGAGRGA